MFLLFWVLAWVLNLDILRWFLWKKMVSLYWFSPCSKNYCSGMKSLTSYVYWILDNLNKWRGMHHCFPNIKWIEFNVREVVRCAQCEINLIMLIIMKSSYEWLVHSIHVGNCSTGEIQMRKKFVVADSILGRCYFWKVLLKN